MAVLVWILQVVIFLALWKVAHLLFWNLRKLLAVQSLLFAMGITLIIAILAVVGARLGFGAWGQVVFFSVLIGIASGEYEFNRGLHRT